MKPEQLEGIRKRSSATSGNWLADYLKLQSAQIVLTDDVPALIDEVERLREALKFYANTDNYEIDEGLRDYYNTDIEDDYGQLARDTLGGVYNDSEEIR